METYDYKLKICIIGDSMTGKSALLNRFINNSYYNDNNITIGIDFKSKAMDYEGKKIKLMIWDTAGQERFAGIVKVFYKNSDAIIITFDITNIASFYSLKKWINKVKANAENDPYIIIVGNKYDIEEDRITEKFDINFYLEKYNYDYIEISAKTNFNIDNLFQIIISNIIKNKNKNNNNNDNYNNNYFQLIRNYIYRPSFNYCTIM